MFSKKRADGTIGVRVDDYNDLVFDVAKADIQPKEEAAETLERMSAEERMRELLITEPSIGSKRVRKKLIEEGYSISSRQVRALKANFKQGGSQGVFFKTCPSTTAPGLTPILSERRPAKHRTYRSLKVVEEKEAGNRAYVAQRFDEAERHYSNALKYREELGNEDEANKSVHLWQLYGNRCSARLQMGKLDGSYEGQPRIQYVCTRG